MRQRETKKVEKKEKNTYKSEILRKKATNKYTKNNKSTYYIIRSFRTLNACCSSYSFTSTCRALCAPCHCFCYLFFFLLFCKFRHLLFIVLFRLCIPFNVAVFDGFFSKKCTKAHNKKVTCTETHTSNK